MMAPFFDWFSSSFFAQHLKLRWQLLSQTKLWQSLGLGAAHDFDYACGKMNRNCFDWEFCCCCCCLGWNEYCHCCCCCSSWLSLKFRCCSFNLSQLTVRGHTTRISQAIFRVRGATKKHHLECRKRERLDPSCVQSASELKRDHLVYVVVPNREYAKCISINLEFSQKVRNLLKVRKNVWIIVSNYLSD